MSKPENEKYNDTTATGREEVLVALRAAAQAKGSPLSTDELKAVYAQFDNQ